MGDLNASAVGLAVILALALALFLLKQEDSDETRSDNTRDSGKRRRMW